MIAALEERWADELPEGVIPTGIRRNLRATPRFAAWVGEVMRGQGIRLADLDVVPQVTRGLNGRAVSLLELELGDDPRRWYCPACHEELERPAAGPCDACKHWKRHGRLK